MLHILANSVTNLPHTHYKYMKELNILPLTFYCEDNLSEHILKVHERVNLCD